MSIFDQDNRTENPHSMNVKETGFPEKFRPIIRCLQVAAQARELSDIMTVEDDFMTALNDYEHRTAEATKQRKEERRQKDEAIIPLLSFEASVKDIAQRLGLKEGYIRSLA